MIRATYILCITLAIAIICWLGNLAYTYETTGHGLHPAVSLVGALVLLFYMRLLQLIYRAIVTPDEPTDITNNSFIN